MDQPISVVWVEVSVLLEALTPLKCVSILPNDLIYIYLYIYMMPQVISPQRSFSFVCDWMALGMFWILLDAPIRRLVIEHGQ